MLITDQHTYPSPAPASPTSHPPGRELPRLPADSSWNGPHRRSRCTQGSRETDESTLRPENAEKRSFCPLSSSLQKQHGEKGRGSPLYTQFSSSSNRLLCASFDFSRRRLTWSSDRRRIRQPRASETNHRARREIYDPRSREFRSDVSPHILLHGREIIKR